MCKSYGKMDKETTNCFVHVSQSGPVAQKVNPPIDDSNSINLEELDFEAQGSIRWDDWWEATCSVCVVRRHCKYSFLASGKLGSTFVPSFDDFADADLRNERIVPISTGIELLPIVKSSNIVNRNFIAFSGEIAIIARLNSFDGDAHDEDAELKMTMRRVYIRNRAGRGGC